MDFCIVVDESKILTLLLCILIFRAGFNHLLCHLKIKILKSIAFVGFSEIMPFGGVIRVGTIDW